MALRMEHRITTAAGQIKRRLPLLTLSVHPENRGGVYPQGDDVKQLAIRLAKAGFSQEEADHQGSVCKSHLPPQLRQGTQLRNSTHSTTYDVVKGRRFYPLALGLITRRPMVC